MAVYRDSGSASVSKDGNYYSTSKAEQTYILAVLAGRPLPESGAFRCNAQLRLCLSQPNCGTYLLCESHVLFWEVRIWGISLLRRSIISSSRRLRLLT